ncbi:MAG: type I secretion C-terminal target domain-containing protein [Kiloniellales bacterium]
MGFRLRFGRDGTNDNDIIIGTRHDDEIDAKSGNDIVLARHGDDEIHGGSGRDWLYGGRGADELYGEDDDDHLIGERGEDRLFGGNGDDLLYGDSLNGSGGWRSGSGYADYLDGGAGDDKLYGGDGADSLLGGAGNDVLYGDDSHHRGSGSGHGSGNGKWWRRGRGSGSHGSGGGSHDGSGYADYLNGGAGDDILFGGKGADTLDGGTGADEMFGGKGDDSYFVDDAGDTVVEHELKGIDEVFSTVDYVLPENVENLTLLDIQGAPLSSYQTDFETFTTGVSIAGQDGWSVSGTFDESVEDISGNTVWQVSNALTSGAFGNQPFAPRPGGIPNPPADPDNSTPNAFAGESATGAAGTRFFAEFDFSSATGAAQPGLSVTVSPDSGQGGRQGFFDIEDNGTSGLRLVTFDVDADGNFIGPIAIADNLSYSEVHRVGIEVLFNDGPGNDVAHYYLDGTLIHTGQSWEQFYSNFQPALHPNGVPVQTLLFRLSGDPDASVDGEGLFIDNLSYEITDIVPLNGTGNELDNTIAGNGGDNELSGLAGDDTLVGGAGKDTLTGGAGDDLLDGGTGQIDLAVFSGDVSEYVISYLGNGEIQVADTVAGRDGTDTLADIEFTSFNGAVTELGPVLVFDEIDLLVGTFATIQDGVDNADDGYTILIGAGTYNESVHVTSAVSFVGAGIGNTIVTPPAGSAFVIDQDLGAANSVTFTGLGLVGATRSGIQFSNAAVLGTLAVYDSLFEANAQNGIEILEGGGLSNGIVEDSRFVGNGQPSSSSGDGDILFYQYNGAATIRNVQITGQDRGTGEEENAIQFRSDSGSMGNVTLENVVIDGVFEKQAIAIFNYDDVSGLQMTDVDLSGADSTGFQTVMNFDGIGGDIDFSDASQFEGVLVPGLTDPVSLQGDGSAQVLTGRGEGELLRGFGGADSLNGNGGDDILIGGTGSDLLDGGSGNDVFLWASGDADGSTDTVADFGDGSDVLNLADVLGGTPSAGNIGTYLNAVAGGSDTTLEVDVGGASTFGAGAELFIVLQGVSIANGDLDELVNSGQIVVV